MMKRLLYILILVVCTKYFAFSQTPKITVYNFEYNGAQAPPCYLKDNKEWKSSHGSPCYYNHNGQGAVYKWLRLDATFTNGGSKSEGVFTDYKFSKCNNYKIEITYKDIKESPSFQLYAANKLFEKFDTACNVATLPNVAEKEYIAGGSAVCAGINHCTATIPSGNSYWNPKKDYNQFWVYSLTVSSNSTSSFVISEIKIMDYGKVQTTTSPTPPGNLRVTDTTGTTISIKWDPSYDVTGIEKYVVSCNDKKFDRYTTSATVSGLKECTGYTIGVQAVSNVCGTSDKTSVNAATKGGVDSIVLNKSANSLPISHHQVILIAGKYIKLLPGFSVKNDESLQFFAARIRGCGSRLSDNLIPEDEEFHLIDEDNAFEVHQIIDFQLDEEYPYLIDEEMVLETAIDTLPYIADNEIRIYPNPTTRELSIESGMLIVNTLEIFDITGKPLLSFKPQNSISNIDISTFSSGVYFIKIVTQGDIFMRKLIKM